MQKAFYLPSHNAGLYVSGLHALPSVRKRNLSLRRRSLLHTIRCSSGDRWPRTHCSLQTHRVFLPTLLRGMATTTRYFDGGQIHHRARRLARTIQINSQQSANTTRKEVRKGYFVKKELETGSDWIQYRCQRRSRCGSHG